MLETTQMFIHYRMEELNVVYSCSEILYSYEKEQTKIMHSHMDESHKL